jgi:hypothetical protein
MQFIELVCFKQSFLWISLLLCLRYLLLIFLLILNIYIKYINHRG